MADEDATWRCSAKWVRERNEALAHGAGCNVAWMAREPQGLRQWPSSAMPGLHGEGLAHVCSEHSPAAAGRAWACTDREQGGRRTQGQWLRGGAGRGRTGPARRQQPHRCTDQAGRRVGRAPCRARAIKRQRARGFREESGEMELTTIDEDRVRTGRAPTDDGAPERLWKVDEGAHLVIIGATWARWAHTSRGDG
jgi:hypothetical protein